MNNRAQAATASNEEALVLSEVDRESHIAVVTLNRPRARNALNAALLAELRDAFGALDADPEVRAIVLTGAGPAFCAGLDLNELSSRDRALDISPGNSDGSVNAPWDPMATPVVGAINGPAVTGGLEVALACDVLVGSSLASFADTHVRIGIMPGWGLSVVLPAVVGRLVARRMSLTGDFVLAEEALARGLLTAVVAPEDLLAAARTIAETIAANDPRTVQEYLSSYRKIELEALGSGYAVEAATSAAWSDHFQSSDVDARRRQIIDRGRRQVTSPGGAKR